MKVEQTGAIISQLSTESLEIACQKAVITRLPAIKTKICEGAFYLNVINYPS